MSFLTHHVSPTFPVQHWFVLFSTAIRQPNFPDPVVLVRNRIEEHQRAFAAEASHIVSTQVELFRSTRMITVSVNNLSSTPPNSPPTADSPTMNLEQRLLAFHRSMSNTPQRHIPGIRPRANRDVHDIVTEQYNIALHSPYGSAFHTRDATYMRRQEFLFRSNMAEQLARFGRTPQTDYSSILPPTLVSHSLVLGINTSITGPPPRSVSPFTQDLTNAHEIQKQLQLQHIKDTGVTSNAATTILAMNTQAVLDAAESIYGSSSAPTSTRGFGILRHTPASEQQPSFRTATITRPRPKPLNFGLDQRERDVLLAVNQATNTPDVPVDSDYDDCSIPGIPSKDLPTIYAAQQRDHVSQITGDTTTTHHSTTRVLRTPLEFYTAMAPNDPLAEDPYTYGTTVQQSSPRRLVYPRVSAETTLTALREANSPPPAHCTRSKSDSHGSRRG